MSQDYLGNPLDTSRPDTVAAINDFTRGMLGYDPCALNVLAGADADAESRLVNALAGLLCMFDESPRAPSLAAPYLQRALAAPVEHPRASVYSEALQAWIEDDLPRLLSLTGQLLQHYPQDLFAAKLNQYIEFNRGNWPALLRIGLQARDQNPRQAQAHGMLAFAYEQCHLLDDAQASARLALQLQPDEPWAQHALAHVLLTEGRIDEGIAFLTQASHGWRSLNSFMYTHNWWHLALFHLARGHSAQALDIYDQHIWGVSPDYSQDQVGAVSMLARLELAGIDVGTRWQQLAIYLRHRVGDVVQPFLSVQYLYGLGRAGSAEAQSLLDALRGHAAQAPAFNRHTWQAVTVPLAEGLLAHAQCDYERSVERLAVALPGLNAIGGSHAQRDLFALIELDALVRTKAWAHVQQSLELRRRYDPLDVPTNRQLLLTYTALGLPQQAAQAQANINRVTARLRPLPH